MVNGASKGAHPPSAALILRNFWNCRLRFEALLMGLFFSALSYPRSGNDLVAAPEKMISPCPGNDHGVGKGYEFCKGAG
jgi:hypothetical protein